jgi:ribosomal protein S18 acetylase RimI-like enzyme
MNNITIRQAERFPEPDFSQLQERVFCDVQEPSAALAQVLHTESLDFPEATPAPATSFSPFLRLGAYDGDELVGWSFGWLERGRVFYMANSGVLETHRRQGVYSALVDAVCGHARAMGAVMVRSQHSVLNNAVIIAKLRMGFHVAGMSQSAQLGSLVELVRHLSEERNALFRSRVVPYVAESS